MDEREPLRSWDEIRTLHPDRWVALEDVVADEVCALRGGRFVLSAGSRIETYAAIRPLSLSGTRAVCFTGALPRTSEHLHTGLMRSRDDDGV